MRATCPTCGLMLFGGVCAECVPAPTAPLCGRLGHVFPENAPAGTPCQCGAMERNESERGMRGRRTT